MFDNAADMKAYTLAGNATLTLTSERTGAHYTFRISQAKDKETGEKQPLWFVGLLIGPDNYADYSYLGVIRAARDLGDPRFQFAVTGKSKFKPDSVPARAFGFFWRHVDGEQMPAEMTVQHEGSCGRCGRKLTHPESLTRGIGPECWEKMGGLG
jgi:hypothetical protein